MPPLVQVLHADTYLAMIQGSIGSQAYRKAFALVDGVRTDLVNNGEYSCAFFVGDLLLRFKLTKEPHLRVQGLVKDLIDCGWIETSSPQPGDVIVWDPIVESDGKEHLHVGFYMGHDQAISNSTSKRSPGDHHWTYGIQSDGTPFRKIKQIFTHPTFFTEATYRKG